MNNQVRAQKHVGRPGFPDPEATQGLHSVAAPHLRRDIKQRVSITVPISLLERLRNAVYWDGHITLARLITDALTDAVCELEEANGGTFPTRLAPLKRGRPPLTSAPLSDKTSR